MGEIISKNEHIRMIILIKIVTFLHNNFTFYLKFYLKNKVHSIFVQLDNNGNIVYVRKLTHNQVIED